MSCVPAAVNTHVRTPPSTKTSDVQRSEALGEDSPTTSGAASTGGQGICLSSHKFPDIAPRRKGYKGCGATRQCRLKTEVRGAGLAAEEGSLPTSAGTCSDSARPSRSPVLSEGGGEEHAMQGVDHTEAGEEELPKKRGKRKLPLPDLDAIEDADERRRQRRLIKNRNTAAASRLRKQQELEELSRRMRSLEQDNASLRSHVVRRDAEVASLRALVGGLQSPHTNPPQALSTSDSFLPMGPGSNAQRTMERAKQQESTGEALHQLPAQQQSLHGDYRAMSLAQSHNASYRLGGPAGIWGDPHDMRGQDFDQHQHVSHQPIHLKPALPEDQFARAFGDSCRPSPAVPAGQGKAAPAASSATSSLSTAEQAARAPGGRWHQSLSSGGPQRMAPHRRGGGASDAEAQLLPMDPGAPGAGTHADFLTFPWPEVMDMVGQQEQQPPDPAEDWQL